MAAATEHDAGYTALTRHLYWAFEPGSRETIGSKHIREEAMSFVYRMRADEHQVMPMGEMHLRSSAPWRRRWKYLFLRASRFAFRRYDRLLADAGELTVALSERVIELEAEVDELGERIAALEGGKPAR
jgi:hypothetical protein